MLASKFVLFGIFLRQNFTSVRSPHAQLEKSVSARPAISSFWESEKKKQFHEISIQEPMVSNDALPLQLTPLWGKAARRNKKVK